MYLLKGSSVLVVLAMLFVLSACGSSEVTDLQESTQITIDGFSLSSGSEYHEGQTVSLSLNSDNAGAMTYDWEVRGGTTPIEFSGQNTSTITFVAPEVSRETRIYVDLRVDGRNTILIGDKNYDTYVTVLDTDPLDVRTLALLEVQDVPAMVEVTDFDLSNVVADSTWLLHKLIYSDDMSQLDPSVGVEEGELYLGIQRLAYLDANDDVTELRGCSDIATQELATYLNASITGDACSVGVSTRRYQSGNAFRVEEWCGNELKGIAQTEMLSEGQSESYVSLNLAFENTENLEVNTEVCANLQELALVSHDDTNGDGYPDNLTDAATRMDLETTYQQQPLVLLVAVNELGTRGFESLSRAENDFLVASVALPELIFADVFSGWLDYERTTSSFLGDIDVRLETLQGEIEEVEGTFTLDY